MKNSGAVGRFAGGSGNSRAAARLQQARTMDSGGAQAQLQSTNANLEQELTRQRAALDAHQRFAQRSLATSEADKTRATQAAGEAAQRIDELSRQLAEATQQRNAAEEELRSLLGATYRMPSWRVHRARHPRNLYTRI